MQVFKFPKFFATVVAIQLLFLVGQPLCAEPSHQSILEAVDRIIHRFSEDIAQFDKNINRVAIVNINATENVKPETYDYFMRSLEGAGGKDSRVRFQQCRECAAVRAEVQDEHIVVKKGLPTTADLQAQLKSKGSSYYLEGSFVLSDKNVNTALTLMALSDQSVVWKGNYSESAISTNRNGTKFSVTAGQGKALSLDAYPITLALSVTQRMNAVEFGLGAFGSTQHGDLNNYLAVGPMLLLSSKKLFNAHWGWGDVLLGAKTHFGWYNKKYRDLMIATGIKTEIGSVYHVLVEYYKGTSLESKKRKQDIASEITEESVIISLPSLITVGFGVDV